MKKAIIIIIVLVILVGTGFYLWQNRHDYFFQGEEPYKTYDTDKNNDGTKTIKNIVDDSDESQDNKVEQESEENKNSSNSTNTENQELLDILQNDCDNQCVDKKDTDDYKYCLNICGFSSSSQSVDCGEISNEFDRDTCYKNQAIKEKNAGVCNDISDSRLKDNCKDRVIEELFN